MSIYIVRKSDNWIITNEGQTYIPPDEANPKYQEFLRWVAQGNVPELLDDDAPTQLE